MLWNRNNNGCDSMCCGTCKYNLCESYRLRRFACNNEESEMYGILTQYDDYCADWEPKK